MMWADQAMKCVSSLPGLTVLDIGAGAGSHAREFREDGRKVTTIDLSPPADWVGRFQDFPEEKTYDILWASHVLEHQTDVGAFLRKCFRLLVDDGVLAVTVPPSKKHVVGGHVAMFNGGTLIYNAILAGFDCREAMLKSYGYNISLIVRKKEAKLPEGLTMDAGDIERLAHFFPVPVKQGFNGELISVNW